MPTMIIVLASRRPSKLIKKGFFWARKSTEKTDGLSVMSFVDQSASGLQEICDLLAKFIKRTYVDDSWVPSSPFELLQLTALEVEY
jgi:hypothetical protein